ncbi:NADPH:quinone reductase-like Zn-dependent oxidoreductase [Pontibacter aydingkolensis]|uniref:NADP-dependent oxidoreductase n=1 Tax=Pontibacter aydingkolensis TaxID=1911536 RepID=A0ABS7CZL5_9BACT|nr:NADP-dependent oxidoreductase [Pontibacter aydingkolensis]MBW7469304.1 NADP-dependent oxidoreductase [Pontibacter aydingkolensis]
MTDKMKAATYKEFGGAEKIEIKTVDIPEIKEGEVLVKIKAAGVNPVDAFVREGYLKEYLPYEFPIIPGWDMAGTIEKRGFSARRFEIGDAVYAYARRPIVQHGTFAEYIVIPESYLAAKPESISFEEAAGIPLVGLTAYQSLFDAGKLQKGQTVLILGGSGGVGSLGIQLAKAEGATVIAVASEKNHAFMKELGADHTIDYKGQDVGGATKKIAPDGVDLIFDCASGDTLKQSLSALKSSGKLVSIVDQGQDLDSSIDFQYVFVEPNSSQLDKLREYTEAGQMKVYVSNTYNLEQTAEALNQIQTLHTKGKIVIVP